MKIIFYSEIKIFLDDYYEQCVIPKPNIPKHYGFHVEKRQRQAARLQSYKENPDDEDELEDEEEEQMEELNSSIEDSNRNQISFEINDFNKIYEEAESQNSTNNSAIEPKTEIPASSAQWRITPINVNRPQGAAPLVPMDAPRDNPKTLGYRYHNRKHMKRRNYRFNSNNNNNNSQQNNNANTFNRNNSVHSRLGHIPNRYQQRGKKWIHGFKNKPENNRNNNNNKNYNNNNNTKNNNTNNNNQQEQKVLMNIDGHFPNTRSQLIVSSSLNSNPFASSGNNLNNNCFQSYQQQANANWQLGSNSLTALINSANQIRPSVDQASGMQNINNNNNMANNKNNTLMNNNYLPINNNNMNNNNIINNNNMADNNINNMANINNNIANRLGSRIGTNSNILQQSNNGLFGNGMNQVNRNQHGCSIASDSLRLADLMNLDANSCINLNVAEVARNAMILLSTVVHKPMLDVDVQQQLSNLQVNVFFFFI